MQGELAEGVVPGLLRELYVGRRSGTLHLSRGDERQSVRVRHGHIVNAYTNVSTERLGEILVRRGLLSAENLARATEIVTKEKKRLGHVLLELGLMDQNGLEDAVALHVHGLLAKVFTWNEGLYSFEEEQEALGEELTLKLSTGELILEAVQAIRDPDVVRYTLGDMDRVLNLSDDPLLRFQQVSLSPADGFVLSRVDGTLSAREIEAMIPLPEEEVQRSLLGLLSTGIIQFTPERRSRPETGGPAPSATVVPPPAPPPPENRAASGPPVAPPPAAPPVTAPPPPRAPAEAVRPAGPTSPPPTPERVPTATAPAVTPPAAGADGAEDDPASARRREILEVWEGLDKKDHFEVLGLPRASSATDVKEAYFRLAKRFHPDVHHGASLGDLRDKLEKVFIKLGEAYDVLRDPARRGEYEARLGRFRPSAAQESAPPGGHAGPAVPDPEEEERHRLAAVRRAESLHDLEKYWDAIQLVEPIVDTLSDEKIRLRARLVLARCYLKNLNWAKRGEETLLAAVQDDSQAVEAFRLLGALYRDRGLRSRAASMFRRVLELQPEDREAKEYLARQEPDSAPRGDDGGGGLLRKIFKRP